MPDSILSAASGNPLLKSPPVIVFSDNFNRGNASLVGQLTPVGAKTWLRFTSGGGSKDFVVSGNAAGGTGDNSRQLMAIDCATGDGILRVTYKGGGANSDILIPFRIAASGPTSNYLVLTVASGKWTLRKVVAGVTTMLVATPVAAVAGQIIEIRLAGASIKVYVDGVLAGSTTETDLQTETRHGIGSIAASSAAPVVLWDDVSFTIPGS